MNSNWIWFAGTVIVALITAGSTVIVSKKSFKTINLENEPQLSDQLREAMKENVQLSNRIIELSNKIDKIQRLFDNEHTVRLQSDKKVKELNAKLDKLQEKLDAN